MNTPTHTHMHYNLHTYTYTHVHSHLADGARTVSEINHDRKTVFTRVLQTTRWAVKGMFTPVYS